MKRAKKGGECKSVTFRLLGCREQQVRGGHNKGRKETQKEGTMRKGVGSRKEERRSQEVWGKNVF